MFGRTVFTRADVQNMVVSILGLDSVHCNLGQLPPARLCLQQDRSVMLRENRPVHHRMRTHEAQHLIGKLLGAGEAAAAHFTGTLLRPQKYRESGRLHRDRTMLRTSAGLRADIH